MNEGDNLTLPQHICIYCKKSSDKVTFNSRDHIIPKGFGGKRRLEKGFVCDTCNNELLSSLEQFMQRDSVLSIPKILFGPGSEGRIPKTREDVGKIVLIKSISQDFYKLGVMVLEKPILIDQLLVCLDESLLTKKESNITIKILSSAEVYKGKESEFMSSFFQEMNKYTKGREIKLVFDEIRDNEYLFGFHRGKFIIACNSNGNLDLIKKLIGKIQEKDYVIYEQGQPEKSQSYTTITASAFLNDRLERALTKSCMNVIALEKGKNEILQPKFDCAREFVISGKRSFPSHLIDKKRTQSMSSYLFKYPNDSHQIYIVNALNGLWGFISFYGDHFQFALKLSDEMDMDYNLPFGFLCDWKSGKELLLSEYFIEQSRRMQ